METLAHNLSVRPTLETSIARDLLTKPTLLHGSLVGLFGEVTFEPEKVTFESLDLFENLHGKIDLFKSHSGKLFGKHDLLKTYLEKATSLHGKSLKSLYKVTFESPWFRQKHF